MGTTPLTLILLFIGCFSLATHLVPRQREWLGDRPDSANVVAAVMGESRRVLAGWIYQRADVYFHSGYYASVFDAPAATPTKNGENKTAAAPAAGAKATPNSSTAGANTSRAGSNAGSAADHSQCQHDHGKCAHSHSGCDHDHGRPKSEDWIARFSRNFYPSVHTHLGKNGDEREILPWLRLSAEFDPQRVETYVVGAFWLHDRLGRVAEAEQFLREGLRANPGSHAILFALGRCYSDRDRDPARARNLWELAFTQWLKTEGPKPQPDLFAYSQIVAQLAALEEREGDLDKSIRYLRLLKKASPHPESIETRIVELTKKLPREQPTVIAPE